MLVRQLWHLPIRVCNVVPTQCLRRLHTRMVVSKMYPVVSEEFKISDDGAKGSSFEILLKNRCVFPGSAGTFTLLPHTQRAMDKLIRIIDTEMKHIGAQKIAMPCLAPGAIWKKSKRWDEMGRELLTLKDRHSKPHCLAPTHEEAVTCIVAGDAPVSYKNLPIQLYQIGRKFRDEMRPKNGLLRTREFDMKDLYTFDMDESVAMETYRRVCQAYENILQTLGLHFVKVDADSGAMGGSTSQEFHLLSPVGEDKLYTCSSCQKAFNAELKERQGHNCGKPDCDVTEVSGIEIAHCFILGTKYSDIFNATYRDVNGSIRSLVMGCYGIGVSRLIGASVEVLSRNNNIRWPRLIAPHQICIIPQKEGYKSDETYSISEAVYDRLSRLPNLHDEVYIDDRLNMSIGKRVRLAKQQGTPFIITVGKRSLESESVFEVISVYEDITQYLTLSQIMDNFTSLQTVVLS